jgi:hypothetical protein
MAASRRKKGAAKKRAVAAAAVGLQLKYAFVPNPNPIRASVPGANPNVVDLVVMVSNQRGFAVTISQITIQIPVGFNNARTLSAAPTLPAPLYDTTGA